MAHILNCEDVAISRGSRPILGDVNLSLADGNRIGVVGPNGSGKSTLLRLLTRQWQPDSGRVTVTGGTRMAVLSQRDDFADEITVREAIHGDSATFEWASDARIRQIHEGLMPDVDLDWRVNELSGGQRRRVALTATLVQDAQVVVLDEPTNHLDVSGIDFLARYLNDRFGRGVGALVVVTHDRWFLDMVCTQLWDVVPGHDGPGGRAPVAGTVQTYEGGYAAYVLQRAERSRLAQQAQEKRANLLRKELAWLRRGAPARTSKPKFRIEAANELIANEPPPRDSIELAKLATARLGKKVIDVEDVDFSWTNRDPMVLRGVTIRLAPGQRIGILGANGAGKSSLLGLLSGQLQPTRGMITVGKTVISAVLDQDTSAIDEIADRRVVEAVSDIARYIQVGDKTLSAAQLVEQMGFTRERAWTRVAELSGGERRRLQFMRLLLGEPNVLILDEPTNDLDTDTLAAIEDVLDSWAGTLIVVSHDRYFLERVTDTLYAVIDHQLRHLPGGVTQYLELSSSATSQAEMTPNARTATQETTDKTQGLTRSAYERQQRKRLATLERKMENQRALLAQNGSAQAQCVAQGQYEEIAELGRRARQIEMEIAELETQWFEIVEDLEG
ncbi:ABC-F family ATP-binding cassette domain-containing protein [Trueperella sp. LYQ143]|uniref:ABC-F family ATP-binding cassette domain-containing protein n=1 Tax=Trueperella sp. LYQ143 TaxID=3391059 RepID=UPI00398332B8